MISFVKDDLTPKNELGVYSRIQIQSGHTTEVTGVALSPDGTSYATISKDNTVRIWTLQSEYKGSLLRVLHGHTKPVLNIAWSELDPAVVVTYSEAETYLWNVKTGLGIKLDISGLLPMSVAFRPNNAFVTIGCLEKTSQGRERGVLLSFDYSAAVSMTKGSRVLSAQRSEIISLDAVPISIMYHEDVEHASGSVLLIATRDGGLLSYDFNRKKSDIILLPEINGKQSIAGLVEHQDGVIIIFKNADVFRLKYILPNSNEAVERFTHQGEGSVQWISASPNGVVLTLKEKGKRHFYAIDQQATYGVTAILTPIDIQSISKQGHLASGITKDSTAVVICNEPGTSKEFSTNTYIGRMSSEKTDGTRSGLHFMPSTISAQPVSSIRCVEFDPTGRFAYSGDNAGNLLRWDISPDGMGDAQQLSGRPLFRDYVTNIAIDRGGKFGVFFGYDPEPTLLLYDLSHDSVIVKVPGIRDENIFATFSSERGVTIIGKNGIYLYTPTLRSELIKKLNVKAACVGERDIVYFVTGDSLVSFDTKTLTMKLLGETGQAKMRMISYAGNNSLVVLLETGKIVTYDNGDLKQAIYGVANSDHVTAMRSDPLSRKIMLALNNGSCISVSPQGANGAAAVDTFNLHDSKIYCMSQMMSPNGESILMTGGLDGQVAFLCLSRPSITYHGYPIRVSDSTFSYISYSSDRYFDARSSAKSFLRYVSGMTVYSIDELFLRCNAPKLLSQLQANRTRTQVAEIIKTPPAVRILNSFSNPLSESISSIKLTVQVTVHQSGLSRLLLYRGNTLLFDDPLNLDGEIQATILRTFDVGIDPDTNHIRVVALDDDGTAPACEMKVVSERKMSRPRLFVIAIGVSIYKDASASLRYAAEDANAIAKVFEERFARSYETASVISVTDKNANRASVLGALERVRATIKSSDAFVFYFAGHGVNVPSDSESKYVLAMHGVDDFNDPARVMSEGLSIDSLGLYLSRIPSKNCLVLLDACYSGKAITAFNRTSTVDRQVNTMQWLTKSIILASVDADTRAQEYDQLKHGMFTYTVLNGLQQSGRGSDDIDIYDLERALANPRLPDTIPYQRPLKADYNVEIQQFLLTRGG